MRYPMPTTTRAKLVRLYYELCLVPGLEPRIIRNWADMISRLIANKAGLRRKLEASDLELPWKPLWRSLQKELWPKKRLHDTSYASLSLVVIVSILTRSPSKTECSQYPSLSRGTKQAILSRGGGPEYAVGILPIVHQGCTLPVHHHDFLRINRLIYL